MRKLRVLLSAYTCRPNRGSEPGIGWNVAQEMARHYDIWVPTQDNDRRKAIEKALGCIPP